MQQSTQSRNNPLSGIHYLWRGLILLKNPSLRRFVIAPLAINITLFLVFGYFAFQWMSGFVEHAVARLPEWMHWMQGLLEIVLFLGLVLLSFFTFTMVANLIAAPFNGPLADAVLSHSFTGEYNTLAWHDSLKELPVTFKAEWQKIAYSISRSLPFLILFWIPGINLIASFLWLLFGIWILALQYLDYPFANKRIYFSEQRQLATQKRWLVLGFGGAVMLATMIPVLNFIIIPAAVIGASLMVGEQFSETG